MKKIFVFLILGIFMFSLVSAEVFKNNEMVEDKSPLLTVLSWDFGLSDPEMALRMCENFDEQCLISWGYSSISPNIDPLVAYYKDCKVVGDNCQCDLYMNDEPLFQMNCEGLFTGNCDEGIYGDSICSDTDYYEHQGCRFERDETKDGQCESGVTPPQEPQPGGIANFFRGILDWIKWLFGG